MGNVHPAARPIRQGYLQLVRSAKATWGTLLLASVLAGCGSPTAHRVAPPTTTSPKLDQATKSGVNCGDLAVRFNVNPRIDNRQLLLSGASGLPGYTFGPTKLTKGAVVISSVPSDAPAASVEFSEVTSGSGWHGNQSIGMVATPRLAKQLVREMQQRQAKCFSVGTPLKPLPTKTREVKVERQTYYLSRWQGSTVVAKVMVAQGRYILSLAWHNSDLCTTYSGGTCPPEQANPPSLPDEESMAGVVDLALSKLKS